MELDKYIGLAIEDALNIVRSTELVVNYGKIEGTEFIEVPEKGYYLQSNDGDGKISEYRVYFEKNGDFFPSSKELRGQYSGLLTISEAEALIGPAIKEIRSIKLPGAKPTMAGKAFVDGQSKIIFYTVDGVNITCLHRKPLG